MDPNVAWADRSAVWKEEVNDKTRTDPALWTRSENKKAAHVGKADHDPDDLFFEENRKSILPELRGKTVKEKPDDEIFLMRLWDHHRPCRYAGVVVGSLWNLLRGIFPWIGYPELLSIF